MRIFLKIVAFAGGILFIFCSILLGIFIYVFSGGYQEEC